MPGSNTTSYELNHEGRVIRFWLPRKTTFPATIRGVNRQLFWIGDKELQNQGVPVAVNWWTKLGKLVTLQLGEEGNTYETVATFHPEKPTHPTKMGRLEINREYKDIEEPIVLTALIMQEWRDARS